MRQIVADEACLMLAVSDWLFTLIGQIRRIGPAAIHLISCQRFWEGEAPAEPIALTRLGRSLALPSTVIVSCPRRTYLSINRHHGSIFTGNPTGLAQKLIANS